MTRLTAHQLRFTLWALVALGSLDWIVLSLVAVPRVWAGARPPTSAAVHAPPAAPDDGIIPVGELAVPSDVAPASTDAAVEPIVEQAPPDSVGPSRRPPIRIAFRSSSAALPRDAKSQLEELAREWTSAPEGRVAVVGFADSRGPTDLNRWLSMRRAEVVKRYLVTLGLPPDRIEVEGRGAREPLDSGQTRDAHARNRRVEVYWK